MTIPGSPISKEQADTSVTIGWSDRLKYLYPPILAMVFSLLFSNIVILSNPSFYLVIPPPVNLYESLIIVLLISLVGGVATYATFLIFQRGSERLHRVIIAAFISPIFFILTIFIGEAILLILVYQGLTNFHLAILAMASIMFASFAIIFVFTDAFGSLGRNIIFTIYGIILGVFIGINFTWYVSLLLLVLLAIQDSLFATKLGPTIVEADQKSHARAAFTFVVGPLIIGIGDLIVFAALVAYSLRYFGWIIALFTFVLILIGSLINTHIASRRPNQVIPGLPIPLICAMIPISLGLLSLVVPGLILI